MNGARRRPAVRAVTCATAVATICSVVATVAVAAPQRGAKPGDLRWSAREAGPGKTYDRSASLATSPDGSVVYLAGSSDGVFLIVARNARTGALLWSVRTPGPGGHQAFADGLTISPDGRRLFVTGEVERSVDTRSTLTIAYDTVTGAVEWSSVFAVGRKREAIPRRIAVTPDGSRVFMAGSRTGTQGPDDFWDFFTLGFDATSGARAWTARYAGPAGGGDTLEGLGVSPDGSRVFVTGTSLSAGANRDIATVAYRESDGVRRWVERFDAGADDFAADLVVDAAGVFVAGYGRASFSDPHGFLVVAYTSAGTQRWVAGPDGSADSYATDAELSADAERIYVTGVGGNDFATAAFATVDGRQLWSERYGRRGRDRANAVAVSPDGRSVYVTGFSDDGRAACFGDIRSTSFATVRYDAATGQQGWVARYGGRKDDPDEAVDVAVGLDGRTVLATGDSDALCRTSDIATVAYRA